MNLFDIVAVFGNKFECCFINKVERCFDIVAGENGAWFILNDKDYQISYRVVYNVARYYKLGEYEKSKTANVFR